MTKQKQQLSYARSGDGLTRAQQTTENIAGSNQFFDIATAIDLRLAGI